MDGVPALELETVSGAREIRTKNSGDGLRDSVEQHLLNPDVIVEVFEVGDTRRGTTNVEMKSGSGMSRDRNLKRVRQFGGFHESGNPSAARRIDLKDVHRTGFEHALEIIRIVTILAGRDIHSGRRAVANESKAFEVVG